MTVSSDDDGMNQNMKISATVPRENAMGIPENITTSVMTTKSIPSVRMVMSGGLWGGKEVPQRLEQQLNAQ